MKGDTRSLDYGSCSQRAHVDIWHTLRAQGVSLIPTLSPKYIPCSYMGAVGMSCLACSTHEEQAASQQAVVNSEAYKCYPVASSTTRRTPEACQRRISLLQNACKTVGTDPDSPLITAVYLTKSLDRLNFNISTQNC